MGADCTLFYACVNRPTSVHIASVDPDGGEQWIENAVEGSYCYPVWGRLLSRNLPGWTDGNGEKPPSNRAPPDRKSQVLPHAPSFSVTSTHILTPALVTKYPSKFRLCCLLLLGYGVVYFEPTVIFRGKTVLKTSITVGLLALWRPRIRFSALRHASLVGFNVFLHLQEENAVVVS